MQNLAMHAQQAVRAVQAMKRKNNVQHVIKKFLTRFEDLGTQALEKSLSTQDKHGVVGCFL